MSYNGSGTFTINSTGQPVVAGTVITATAFNSLTNDLATGLTTAITKDGQTTTTARITFAQGLTSSLVTDSSSVSTGSIITAGGVGIAKALYVGTTANVAGAVTLGGIATFSAQPIFSSLTASSAVATDASKGLVSVTNTGTGNNVLATSPTITTPVISSIVNTGTLTLPTSTDTLVGRATTDTLTNKTLTTPVISSLSSASATALTLQSAGTTAITVSTSQNVGIGTTSPTQKLTVSGAIQATNSSSNFDQSGAQFDYASGAGRISSYISTGSNLQFLTNPNGGASAERMRIDSSGKVLVGTTEADNPTDGIVLYFAAQNSQVIIGHATGTPSGYTYIKFSYNASTIGSITQNGTTAVAYNTSSDYRLKENIAPLTGALAKVAQLKPVTYTWKSSPEETGEGFIAHELSEVCPQAVHGTKDEVDTDGNPKYQGIDTSFLVATLTAAIQELKAINDQQAETINALTARITALENA